MLVAYVVVLWVPGYCRHVILAQRVAASGHRTRVPSLYDALCVCVQHDDQIAAHTAVQTIEQFRTRLRCSGDVVGTAALRTTTTMRMRLVDNDANDQNVNANDEMLNVSATDPVFAHTESVPPANRIWINAAPARWHVSHRAI